MSANEEMDVGQRRCAHHLRASDSTDSVLACKTSQQS